MKYLVTDDHVNSMAVLTGDKVTAFLLSHNDATRVYELDENDETDYDNYTSADFWIRYDRTGL